MSVLSLHGITKQFSQKIALNDVDLTLYSGEIHILLGENGAGKSTLASVICGALQPSKGEIELDGKLVKFVKPEDSRRAGIAMVYQRPLIAPILSCWENIVLGHEPVFSFQAKRSASFPKSGIINKKEAIKRIKQIELEWNINQPIEISSSSLTAAGRFYTSFLAALYTEPSILILDEPCAALDLEQRNALYESLKKAALNGMAILVITHSIQEAVNYSDRITILRKGLLTASIDNKGHEIAENEIISFMRFQNSEEIDRLNFEFENTVEKVQKKRSIPVSHTESTGNPIINVSSLSARPVFSAALFDISFSVNPGQIVFIAGQRESGMETLENIVTGMFSSQYTGKIFFDGAIVKHLKVSALRKFGTGIIPFDRAFTASNPSLSVKDILTAGYVGKNPNEFASSIIEKAAVGITLDEKAAVLSGGMLQRLILAREMAYNPRLLVFSEPLQGLDFYSCKKVLSLIKAKAMAGTAVLLLGVLNPLIVQICDKLYFLDSGYLTPKDKVFVKEHGDYADI